jgi:membrane complex biogenesis BtpA family protein
MYETLKKFTRVFTGNKPVIGMIHVTALPGTPGYGGSMEAVIAQACDEARLYVKAGVDAVAVENMHDVPYLRCCAGPEITAAMGVVAATVKRVSSLPCGIQILAGANKEALAAAYAAGCDFIRAEGFVFAHTADEGIIESCAGELLRYRRQIGADDILIFTDIKKKHSSHALTEDISSAETAHAAEFFASDGVIVTGTETGVPAVLEEVQAVKAAVHIPVLIGSGVTIDNVEQYLPHADAVIVGSHFKTDGRWINTVDYDRTAAFMEKVHALRVYYNQLDPQ